ncbi:hypothetical protein CYMTET_24422 [Cymbomonas tetramitiformis]|uniref:BZIP domain-containing protein n=1 Tax=Cymbomonas tetramitiformis TaxID=36881 RepID=A0AAE0FXA0_9CHLO|nr:hypothetical protein CYMTET_24422 [Cymbomonas tetramitiformis]
MESKNSSAPRRGRKRPLEETGSPSDENQLAPEQEPTDVCAGESCPEAEGSQGKRAQTKRGGKNGKAETGAKRSQPMAQRRYRERVKQRVADLERTVVKLTEQLAATRKKSPEGHDAPSDQVVPAKKPESNEEDLNQVEGISYSGSEWLLQAEQQLEPGCDPETKTGQTIDARFGEAVTGLQILLSNGANDSQIAVQLAVVVDAYLSSMDPLSSMPESLFLDGMLRDKTAAFEKVLALVGLRNEQLRAIIAWRDDFVKKLDNVYSTRRRILLSLNQAGSHQVLQANLQEQKNLTTRAFVQFFSATLGCVRDAARLVSCFAPLQPDLLGLSNFIYQNSERGLLSSC